MATITLESIKSAAANLNGVAVKSPLQPNKRLSEQYQANISFKREDMQMVRSYKIRGAYNKILSLSTQEQRKGIVCASAGNHAQGVAYACSHLQIQGVIFMPLTTPKQKIDSVKRFGRQWVKVVLSGDTFDDAYKASRNYQIEHGCSFVHPFDDIKTIEGQATAGLEIIEQSEQPVDILLIPVGGGGLAAGVTTIFSMLSPHTKIYGVEPKGAPSMAMALKKGYPIELESITKFVDGAAVQQVGSHTFEICKDKLTDMIHIEEGHVCECLLDLYNYEAIVAEPAGVLSIGALEQLKDEIKDKNVVCLISGGNNDLSRLEEMKEKALIHTGIKHYFLINFAQRSGALKEFVVDILQPGDDITHFEYIKRTSRSTGTALVGLELNDAQRIHSLMKNLDERGYLEEYLNDKPHKLSFLI